MQYKFALILAFIMFFVSACESEKDNEKESSDKLMEITCQVETVSFFGFKDGDLAFYDCTNNKRIIFTVETTAMRERESFSGFDRTDFRGIKINDTLIVKYKKENADYSNIPNIFRAASIEAYRPRAIIIK
jgi:hypothetical protein